jgi:PST family polysaccharide transporter
LNDLKKNTISGIKWTTLSKILRQIVQFIVIIVLSRILNPSDFGLISMLIVFTGFANILQNFGLASAIIQKKDVTQSQLSTIFWLNVIIGLILTTSFILLSKPIADFYNEPQLYSITIFLAFNFLITAFTTVQEALIRKRMDFNKLFAVEIIAVSLAGVLSILAAYNDYGVWSLVIQNIIIHLSSAIILWFIAEWRPSLTIQIKSTLPLLKYGANLAGFNIINYFSRNTDNLVIGKYLNASALGIYSRAYQLMLLPVSEVNQILTKVMFPVFSSIQEDTDRIKSIYLKATRMIAFVTFPLMLTISILAEPLVVTLYGIKWKDVATILSIFSFYGLTQSITTTIGWIFSALGKPDLQFKLGIINTAIAITSIIIGLKWGIIGVTVSYTVCSIIILLYPNWYFAFRLIKLSVKEMINNLTPITIISTITGLITLGFEKTIFLNFASELKLIILLLISSVTYLILSLIFKPSYYKELKMIVR